MNFIHYKIYKQIEWVLGAGSGVIMAFSKGFHDKLRDELLHSISTVCTAIIVVIVTHIAKVKFKKWYKKFTNK